MKGYCFKHITVNWCLYYRCDSKDGNFVADSYLHNSIKAAERRIRGENRAVIIKLIKSKVTAGFQSFLKGNGNKTSIIDLLLDYISITTINAYPYLPLILFSIAVESKKKHIWEFFFTVNTF